jgi:cytochrome c
MGTFGKVVLALVLGLVGVEALGLYSDAIFTQYRVPHVGYALPGGGPAAAATPAASSAAQPESPTPAPSQAEAALEPPASLPELLAKADPAKGETDVKVCKTCHAFEKGAPARIGPPLWGVLGRPKGSISGFSYSDGLKAKGGDWSYEDINTFITKPSAFVPGTKMTFPGESSAVKRADILAYLRSLSDSPAPLPK